MASAKLIKSLEGKGFFLEFPEYEDIEEEIIEILKEDNFRILLSLPLLLNKEFNYKNLIKIGFLNDEVKDNIEKYERNFDVVISNDSPMEYVNQLLKELF